MMISDVVIVGSLGTIALGIIGYFLTRTMTKVDETEKLSVRTKAELDVLKNDHINKYEHITEKFDDLKNVIVNLTSKIEALTDKIK